MINDTINAHVWHLISTIRNNKASVILPVNFSSKISGNLVTLHGVIDFLKF